MNWFTCQCDLFVDIVWISIGKLKYFMSMNGTINFEQKKMVKEKLDVFVNNSIDLISFQIYFLIDQWINEGYLIIFNRNDWGEI